MVDRNEPSPADDILIAALVNGDTLTAAAEKAGVARSTLWRRRQDPDFRRWLSEARSAVLAAAIGDLTARLVRAGERLDALLDDPDPNVRLRAVRTTFDYALRGGEQVEIEERLRRLEEVAAARKGDV